MFKRLVNHFEQRVTMISDQDYTPSLLSLEQALVGVSRLYQKAVETRLSWYASGRLKSKSLPCPVLSVGNMVAGGAGKTPMAVYLAERFLAMGKRPVVISRGYKGDPGQTTVVVGDGKEVFLDEARAGDEPVMMASRKRFPVVVGKNRYEAGRLAIREFSSDLLILDDGFQHLALARDLDIVLADFSRPLGNGRMLPAGRLRETPEICCDRIGCVVVTRSPGDRQSQNLSSRAEDIFQDLPLFYTCHDPFLAGWKPAGSDRVELLPETGRSLDNCRAVLFSGIAGNTGFRDSAEQMGVRVLDHLEFNDHYRYKGADFEQIRERATALDADVILTTEKDWVKVDPGFEFNLDLGVMGIRIKFEAPERFDRFLSETILARV